LIHTNDHVRFWNTIYILIKTKIKSFIYNFENLELLAGQE
jgi:hypothetical protein